MQERDPVIDEVIVEAVSALDGSSDIRRRNPHAHERYYLAPFTSSYIQVFLAGSRDPHDIVGDGAGFVLCWSGRPRLRIGHPNEQRELLQVEGDQMVIAIPEWVQSYFDPLNH
jgi:hypothetical protein